MGTVLLIGVVLVLAGGPGGAVSAATNDSTKSMTISHELELTVTDVQADGETRRVWITMPDQLEGRISVESVSASSGSDDVTASASVVDGPDDDGTAETIGVDLSVSGDGTEPVRLKLTVVGTYPDVRNESVPAVQVLTGETRFGVDTDDAIVEAALDETTLTGPSISNALFGITTEGDAEVGTLTLRASSDDFPKSPMEIPLDRLPPIERRGVAVRSSDGRMEMRANLSAKAGQEMWMAVEPETDSAVAIDSISVTPKQSGSFTLDVVRSDKPMADFPAMESKTAALLGYIDIEHSISNENIERASMTLRVSKSKVRKLNGTDRDDIAVFRHGEGGWDPQDTEYIGQTPTHFVYRVTADGFSEWATAGKQASFRITQTELNVTSDAIQVNDGVRVTVKIENRGGADGEYVTRLLLNDVVVEEERVSIAAGGTTQINFERRLQKAETYEVQVNDVIVDEISVKPADRSESSGGESGSAGPPMVPIAAGALALLALLGGALYVSRD